MPLLDEMAVRRARLQDLVDTKFQGNKAACGRALGFADGAYVGQWLRKERPLTEKSVAEIEQKLRIPGWFSAQKVPADRPIPRPPEPDHGSESAPAYALDPVTGLETVLVSLMSGAGSMGPGNDLMHDEVVRGRMPLAMTWISKSIKPTHVDNLRFIHGYGDSMEPTICDGDVLLVDTGVREARIDGVYVLSANERLYIKRVRQRLDGVYEVSSDNSTVKTIDVLDGRATVDVRGRVVYIWNGRRV